MEPLVSIITVTRNLIDAGRQDAFLSALDSVQAQTVRNAEHIVFDGASDDGTQGLIESVLSNVGSNPTALPVSYRSQRDDGVFDAMNRAAQLAQGAYLLFLNADDGLASADVLERLETATNAGEPPDFIYGSALRLRPDGDMEMGAKASFRTVLQERPLPLNALVVRRSVFHDMGGFDTELRASADYKLMLDLALGDRNGIALDRPIARFTSFGVTGNAEARAQEYARIWLEKLVRYVPEGTTHDDAARWFTRGYLPPAMCRAIQKDDTAPSQIRSAARHSLTVALTRKMRPWRKWDAKQV